MYQRFDSLTRKEKVFLITALVTCGTLVYYYYTRKSRSNTRYGRKKPRAAVRVDTKKSTGEEGEEGEIEFNDDFPEIEPVRFRSTSYTTLLKSPAPDTESNLAPIPGPPPNKQNPGKSLPSLPPSFPSKHSIFCLRIHSDGEFLRDGSGRITSSISSPTEKGIWRLRYGSIAKPKPLAHFRKSQRSKKKKTHNSEHTSFFGFCTSLLFVCDV